MIITCSVLPKFHCAQEHSNMTKQDIGLTGFLKASSKVNAGTAC